MRVLYNLTTNEGTEVKNEGGVGRKWTGDSCFMHLYTLEV